MNKFRKIIKNFKPGIPGLSKRVHPKKVTAKTSKFIQRKPFTSFFIVLGAFLLLMILGNVLLSPKATPEIEINYPKQVHVFKLGSAPKVVLQGKVEKSGVIKIVAQTPGIVSQINVQEGQDVHKGTNILSLATNYSGGNASSVSRQIAQTQYNSAKDSYPDQKDLIGKQRQLADKNRDNVSQMQAIATASAQESQNLVSLDQSIIDTLNGNLANYTATNSAGTNDALILQTKEQVSQFQSAVTQLDSSIRNLNLQAGNPTGDIASLSHDIALKQLDIQEKALNMNLEINRLSYNLAAINEATMYPVAPFSGKIERIFVHKGDSVNPGTVLATLSGNNQHVEIVVNVPQGTAQNVSRIEASTINLPGNTIRMTPTYVSQDATEGTFYSIIFQLDDSQTEYLTNSGYVSVEIPIGTGDTTNDVPFIPLDSVTQTQEEAFVFTIGPDNTAHAVKVNLGQIQGNFVEIISGLPKESQVILDRNVIEGDKLEVAK